MRIIVTGSGKAGSWKIRGEQLGGAIGADVIPNADKQTIHKYDAVVFVKRIPSFTVDILSIFDTVDCFKQPTSASRIDIAREIRNASRQFNGVIAATEQMRIDIVADISIPHHYRRGITESETRERIKTVGYEGREQYLGEWKHEIDAQCKKRGFGFVINPENLSDCDLLIGVRGSKWRNYMTDNWKSNVKMANAVAAGVPFIALPEAGYSEMGLSYCRVNAPSDISNAFDSLESMKDRAKISQEYKNAKRRYSLESIAKGYRSWIDSRF